MARAALIAVLVAGCATGCTSGGVPLPRSGPPLASGSTPEPLRYEVTIAGRPFVARSWLVGLLSDSGYHVDQSGTGPLAAYSLARLVRLRVDLAAVGHDSARLSITGETYLGDSARRDSIAGLPESWRLINAADGAAQALRTAARAILAARGGIPTDTLGSPAGDIPGVASGPLVPGTTLDPIVAGVLARTPVGRDVDVCRSASIPRGWLILYWKVDQTRCPSLPDERYRGEPNLMRIEREW